MLEWLNGCVAHVTQAGKDSMGILEMLGAILPWLTPLAAAGTWARSWSSGLVVVAIGRA